MSHSAVLGQVARIETNTCAPSPPSPSTCIVSHLPDVAAQVHGAPAASRGRLLLLRGGRSCSRDSAEPQILRGIRCRHRHRHRHRENTSSANTHTYIHTTQILRHWNYTYFQTYVHTYIQNPVGRTQVFVQVLRQRQEQVGQPQEVLVQALHTATTLTPIHRIGEGVRPTLPL